jgi:NAD(P)-dependent dehydrogenase (short-subunit alcohol dehydrogenase family)
VPGYRGPGYTGRVAVVTGAASGIGYAVAARAAAEGMTVVLADIDTGKLRDAATALRGTAPGDIREQSRDGCILLPAARPTA